MALFDTTPAHTPDQPINWGMLGTVFLCIFVAFFAVVMMAIEAGGPQGFVQKGTLYTAGLATVVAPIFLWGIYRKGSFAGFVLSAGITVSALMLAAAAFAIS